jgi:hypothetical protein
MARRVSRRHEKMPPFQKWLKYAMRSCDAPVQPNLLSGFVYLRVCVIQATPII